MNEYPNWIGDLLAFLALIVSAIALYISWKHNARLLSLENQKFQIEKKREFDRLKEMNSANLVITSQKTREQLNFDFNGQHYMAQAYYVTLSNKGSAKASNITVLFDGSENHPSVRKVPDLTSLGPGSDTKITLSNIPTPPTTITLEWDDGTGERQTLETSLGF